MFLVPDGTAPLQRALAWRRPCPPLPELVVVIVVIGQPPGPRVDHELAGLAVLRPDGFEIVTLPRDLDVGVALRLQLLPDLRLGHGLVTRDEDRPSRSSSCDYQAS